MPSSKRNLNEAELEVVKEDRAYDMLLWSMVLIQYALLAWFLMDLAGGAGMWSLEWWGFVLAMGFSCSILGINVAHELGHRPERHNQLLSQALLTTSLYTHFFIEHNQGHHRNVATKEDPEPPDATNGSGVLVPSGVCRVVVRWKIEAKNMRRKGLSLGIPPTPSSAFKPCNGVCLRPSGSDWAGKSAWPGSSPGCLAASCWKW